MVASITYKPVQNKQIVAPSLADESGDVRKIMGAAAAEIVVAFNRRPAADKPFLYENVRADSRRDYDNLTRMIRLARESGHIHAVSDAIRAYELATAPASDEPVSAIDLHLAEEAAEAALDQAQLLALQDGACPARAAGIVETARQAMHRLSALVDYYARRMTVARRTV